VIEFSTAARIVFGSGSLAKLPEIVLGLGRRVLLVTGGSQGRGCNVQPLLQQAGILFESLRVSHEPTVADVALGVELCQRSRADVVVGFGGGSVLDTAKAIAAVSTNPGELLDYLEVVGRGNALTRPGLPCVAVPTTAGTGAEVTRNAVIEVTERKIKVSLRGSQLLPRVALIDPQLTLTVPSSITAATGFDALTQVIEPFLSLRHNPITDGMAREGIRLAASALPRAYANGNELSAREDMAMASLLGGLCLANSGLGAVHGLAGPLGGMFHAPHGALCAVLLAPTLTTNYEAHLAESSTSQSFYLERYRELARLLTKNERATVEDGFQWIRTLTTELQIPKLSSYGIALSDLGSIVERAMHASSMKANAVKLSVEALTSVLRLAL
jgi:alcohol dehydrogenase class IV